MPEQLPDITADPGAIATEYDRHPPMPDFYITMAFQRSGLDNSGLWHQVGACFTKREYAELAGRNTLSTYWTAYRVVRIPGDEKGGAA